MPTTLAQRIKAARSYADLRRQDIADACTAAGHKVSRSAVAQWEYDDERRTQPSIEHMKILAKRTGVPLDWLLNDSADLADIWRFAKLTSPAPSAPMPLEPAPKSPVTDRFADAFSKAIEFALLQRRPDMAAAFGREFGQGEYRVQPDFVWGNTIAEIKTTPPAADTIGRLLMAEQALSRKMRKVVIELSPTPGEPLEIFGIQVYPVSSPDEAAQALLRLTD